MIRVIEISDALIALRPNSQWIIRGDSYDGIEWLDTETDKPTLEEVQDEVSRLQAEFDKTVYKIKREKEYPDFREYLDGVVKNDLVQIQAYVDACLAVKAKYPKPE